jgi:hypothetical protein
MATASTRLPGFSAAVHLGSAAHSLGSYAATSVGIDAATNALLGSKLMVLRASAVTL